MNPVVKDLICGTKIERPARTALRYAFFLAEELNTSLHVVHTRDCVREMRTGPYLSNQRRLEQLTSEQHELEQLEGLVRSIPSAGTGRASSHIVEGQVAQSLVTYSERHHASLIVLGASVRSSGARGVGEPLADRIGARTLCPVLTVPHGKNALPQIQRILWPVERRAEGTREILAWVALLGQRFGAIVELLHEHACPSWAFRDQLENALRVSGVATRVTACPDLAGIGETCLERITQGECDLIVTSSPAALAITPSLSSRIRRESAVPVLSIRAKDANRIFVGDPPPLGASESSGSARARVAARSSRELTAHTHSYARGQ